MDKYKDIKPDKMGHRTRFSDSSFYDEVCVDCGATDGIGDSSISKPCPKAKEREILDA